MSEQVATTAGIVWHLCNVVLADRKWRGGNWCCGADGELYNVNGETYINGVMLEVDADYYMGYLIEVVDRTEGTLSYIAIAAYHGRGQNGLLDHDFMVYPHQCGTFFNRTEAADRVSVSQWAVSSIYGMFESKADL